MNTAPGIMLPESIPVITKMKVHFLWIISHVPLTGTDSASKQYHYSILGKQSILSSSGHYPAENAD